MLIERYIRVENNNMMIFLQGNCPRIVYKIAFNELYHIFFTLKTHTQVLK